MPPHPFPFTVALSYSPTMVIGVVRGVDDEEPAAAQRHEAVAAARVDDRADGPVDRTHVRVLARLPVRRGAGRQVERGGGVMREGVGREVGVDALEPFAVLVGDEDVRPVGRGEGGMRLAGAGAADGRLEAVAAACATRRRKSPRGRWPRTRATAWVCSLLNRIMCGRTGFRPVAARHRSAVSAPRSSRTMGSAFADARPHQVRAFVDREAGRRSPDAYRTDRRSTPRSRGPPRPRAAPPAARSTQTSRPPEKSGEHHRRERDT